MEETIGDLYAATINKVVGEAGGQVAHISLLRCGFQPQPTAAFSFPKNLSKIACQAPARPKNPLTHTARTTSLQKILGIVVSLQRV